VRLMVVVRRRIVFICIFLGIVLICVQFFIVAQYWQLVLSIDFQPSAAETGLFSHRFGPLHRMPGYQIGMKIGACTFHMMLIPSHEQIIRYLKDANAATREVGVYLAFSDRNHNYSDEMVDFALEEDDGLFILIMSYLAKSGVQIPANVLNSFLNRLSLSENLFFINVSKFLLEKDSFQEQVVSSAKVLGSSEAERIQLLLAQKGFVDLGKRIKEHR